MSERGFGRSLSGVVVGNKAEKTIKVEVTRMVKHPRYQKYIKRRKRYHAHDEKNECHIGDKVVITETKPYSKTKRWRLAEISERAED